jgi:hypothetical protein
MIMNPLMENVFRQSMCKLLSRVFNLILRGNTGYIREIWEPQSDEYVGVPISLWLILFVAQPKEFFLDWLKKLEQRSLKCVELKGQYVE